MKIIKVGNVNPKNRIECDECGCIFEYDDSDVKTAKKTIEKLSLIAFGTGSDITTYEVHSVICPCCKIELEVDREFIKTEWVPDCF